MDTPRPSPGGRGQAAGVARRLQGRPQHLDALAELVARAPRALYSRDTGRGNIREGGAREGCGGGGPSADAAAGGGGRETRRVLLELMLAVAAPGIRAASGVPLAPSVPFALRAPYRTNECANASRFTPHGLAVRGADVFVK